MRLRFHILLALALLLASKPAHSAPAGLERITLIPAGPGGSAQLVPSYDAEELPPFQFEVAADQELSGQEFEDYLLERSDSLALSYRILVFQVDESLAVTDIEAGKLVSSADSPLGGPVKLPGALLPGRLYYWQVEASTSGPAGNGKLLSPPLYFRTRAEGDASLQAADQRLFEAVRQLMVQQERSGRALGSTLAGRRMYVNYPVSSEVYVCSALGKGDAQPLPDLRSSEGPRRVEQLSRIGMLMQQAAVIRAQIREGGDVTALCAPLSRQIAETVGPLSLEEPWQGSSIYENVAALLTRLDPARSELSGESAVGALGELLILLDGMAGPGTLDLGADYQAQFIAYARASQLRLAELTPMRVPLASILGEAETEAWLSRMEGQRGQLALLQDEVESGRLSKQQLAQRMAAQAARLPAGSDFPNVDELLCELEPGAIEQFSMLDESGRRAIVRQLLLAHLERLERLVWSE